jgi:hypothetical protein
MTADRNRSLIGLSENPNSAYMKIDFDDQTKAEQVFHLIWELEAEVNNGGFGQYFSNSSGEQAHQVVTALETIGADATADIARRAIEIVFGSESPARDTKRRQAMVAQLPPSKLEELNECDDSFFRYPNDLTTLLYDFIAANRSSVRGAEDFVDSPRR